ncbi:MAG: hypothetical protein PHG67_13710 [Bacteroidales bacterium]|nr:hypothetical protein [Bacteroidales bacterium]
MNKNEILEELKRLADNNAALDLADFMLYALTYKEIRLNVTDQAISNIQQLAALLIEVKKQQA